MLDSPTDPVLVDPSTFGMKQTVETKYPGYAVATIIAESRPGLVSDGWDGPLTSDGITAETLASIIEEALPDGDPRFEEVTFFAVPLPDYEASLAARHEGAFSEGIFCMVEAIEDMPFLTRLRMAFRPSRARHHLHSVVKRWLDEEDLPYDFEDPDASCGDPLCGCL